MEEVKKKGGKVELHRERKNKRGESELVNSMTLFLWLFSHGLLIAEEGNEIPLRQRQQKKKLSLFLVLLLFLLYTSFFENSFSKKRKKYT